MCTKTRRQPQRILTPARAGPWSVKAGRRGAGRTAEGGEGTKSVAGGRSPPGPRGVRLVYAFKKLYRLVCIIPDLNFKTGVLNTSTLHLSKPIILKLALTLIPLISYQCGGSRSILV